MKKHSALLRASGILLVLTLGTSCFVGGTFAKYVSEADATDTARVAKWGVEVTAVEGDTFSTTYQKHDSNADSSISNTVISTEEVVAPGTDGSFGGISISGQPEVAVKVATTAEVLLSDNWVDDSGDFYCPLVFTIGDTTICGLHYNKNNGGKPALETAIEAAIADAATQEYEPGESLNDINVDYSWAWPFEAGKHPCDQSAPDSTSYHNYVQTDENDTFLGDKAATGDAPTIELTVTTTVTQID